MKDTPSYINEGLLKRLKDFGKKGLTYDHIIIHLDFWDENTDEAGTYVILMLRRRVLTY